jgi:hypothetical protein
MKMAVFWVVAPCSLVEVLEDSHLRTHRHENLKSYKHNMTVWSGLQRKRKEEVLTEYNTEHLITL